MPQLHVLMIEDDPSDVALFRRLLLQAQPDAQLTCAPDGHAALAALAAQPFSLVLVDLELPGMGGLELLAALRQDPAHTQTPVVVLTNHDSPQAVLDVFEAGGNQFLKKPIDAALLQKMLSSAGAFSYTVSRRP